MVGCGHEKEANGWMSAEDFIVVAHRGASAYAPENTLASFDLAEEMNVDYIELDIHLTKDGEIIVMHDEDVAKTTDGKGNVGDYTVDELKELSADFLYEEGEKETENETMEKYNVPTLQEVFDQFEEKMNFMIELKKTDIGHGIEEKLVDLLKENEMIDTVKKQLPKVVVHSFSEKGLKRIHELNKEIPLLKLVTFEDGEIPSLTNKEVDELLTYSSAIGVGYELLDASFIKKMHKKGLYVFATAVQDSKAAQDMKKNGAVGIFTDRPDVLESEEE